MKPNINYDRYKGADFALIDENLSPRIAVCLYCCNVCMQASDNPRKSAYSCKDTTCPLNSIKNQTMKKEHRLTDEQKERFRKQIVINRSKKKKQ